MRGLLTCVLLVFAFSAPAWAVKGLTGYYKDHSGAEIKVVLGPGGKGRIDLAADVFFILDGDKVWTVAELDEGWTLTDFVARTKEALSAKPGTLHKYTRVKVKDTGYAQAAAGYTGQVFEVSVIGTGEVYTLTAVRDPAVARLSRAVMVFFRDFNAPLGGRDVMEVVNASFKPGYGVLNLDDVLVLNKVEYKEYDEFYFDVPAELKSQMP